MRGARALLCALAAAVPLAGVAADEGPLVRIGSLAGFESFSAEHAGFVLFVYAPWCGHSRALLPEVEKAATQLKGSSGLPFAKLDGTEADDVASKLDIKGYPTLLFIHRGDGPPIEYEGERNARAISEWATAKSAPDVKTLEFGSSLEGSERSSTRGRARVVWAGVVWARAGGARVGEAGRRVQDRVWALEQQEKAASVGNDAPDVGSTSASFGVPFGVGFHVPA